MKNTGGSYILWYGSYGIGRSELTLLAGALYIIKIEIYTLKETIY